MEMVHDKLSRYQYFSYDTSGNRKKKKMLSSALKMMHKNAAISSVKYAIETTHSEELKLLVRSAHTIITA